MPGQATITIKESQWSVSLATTYAELTTGLAGIASIAAGTGMLFVLPAEQPVSVTTQSLQFNIDIIFISSDLKVVDVAGDVAPGNVMTENTPVKYFLEVNAGEATGVAAGDTVKIEHLVTILDNVTSVIAFAIPLVALGFVSSLVGGMARVMTGSSPSAHHSPEIRAPYISDRKQIGDKVIKKYSVAGTNLVVYEAREPSELMGPHATITSIDDKWYGRIGTKGPPPEIEKLPPYTKERFQAVSKWYEDQYEEAYRLIIEAFPEAKAGRRSMGEITLSYGSAAEHHSMWLTLEQRKELEKKYGAVAVRWAEEATRPGDIDAADKAAAYYYRKIKEYFALGHGSPELTEEQIMKLRKVLGLTPDVAEILKIHRKTGYVQ